MPPFRHPDFSKPGLILLFLLFAGLTGPSWAGGGAYPFGEIWTQVREKDPGLSAAGWERDAAILGEARAARQWLPRVFLEAKAYDTDDPALAFMSVLEERRIGPADFNPDNLNQPQGRFYGQGTLGMDFTLYGGGESGALKDSAAEWKKAKDWEWKGAVAERYDGLAETYAELLALARERRDLEELNGTLEKILGRYHIGSRDNPAGYSGLLGLRSLKNRLQGLLDRNRADEEGLRAGIRISAPALPADWRIREEAALSFLDRIFPGLEKAAAGGLPDSVEAAKAQARGMERLKSVQTAAFLPRVGLFAEGDFNQGDRASAASYSWGLYLKWNLFSPGNFGSERQAEDSALAAADRAEALLQESQSGKVREMEALGALRSNLALLDDSEGLLREQTKVVLGLYRDGAVGALSLAEVLSRRADLIGERLKVESGLAGAAASLAVQSGFKGGSDEAP
jgi:Outer membrane efflux protein